MTKSRSTRKTIPDEIKERLSRIRRAMSKASLPAFLITNHMDTFYATGFTGEDSAILVQPRAVHVISDGRFDETINEEIPWATRHMRKGLLAAEVGNVCKKLGLKEVGIQPSGMMLSEYQAIKKAIRPCKPIDAPPIMANLREIKSSAELTVLRKSMRIAQDAMKATLATIRPGQTEIEAAARLEFEMRRRGASGIAFGTICATDGNAAHPHAIPGKRRFKKSCMILFDWGARCGFYCSDLTRVCFIGKIPPRIAEVYRIVLEAQLAAIDAIKPGQRCCDIDAVARGIISKAGFGEQFNHGLGHGLGLDVHEAPSLSWRSDKPLKEGMLVTVEPGIYLPGVGGVRIEDDVLVTARGAKVLTSMSKDLNEALL